MIRVVALALALALAAPAMAQDPAKPATSPLTLSELDALRIDRLALERELVAERIRRMQAEAKELDRRGHELNALVNAAVAEAAKRAGVDAEKCKPDIGTRTWRCDGAAPPGAAK